MSKIESRVTSLNKIELPLFTGEVRNFRRFTFRIS